MNLSMVVAAILVVVVATVVFVRKRKRPYFEEGKTLPTPTDKIEVVESKGANRNYGCWHNGPKTYVVSVYGERSKEINDGKRCPECFVSWIGSIVIRCVLCRLPIWPGGGVAVYHESSGELHRKIGTKVGSNYLGCMRWDCCPTGGFFGGNWDGKQFRPAFGGSAMAAAVFESGKPMVVSDTSTGKVDIIDSK